MFRRLLTAGAILTISLSPKTSPSITTITSRDYQISALEKGARTLTVSFELKNFELRNLNNQGQDFIQLTIDNSGEICLEGKPHLPAISRIISLPVDHLATFKIVRMEKEYLRLDSPPAPFYLNSDVAVQNPYIGEAEQIFPLEPVSITSPIVAGGFRFCGLDVFPARFINNECKLEIIRKLEIEVSFSSDPDLKDKNVKNSQTSNHFANLYAPYILNPQRTESVADEFGGYLFILPHPLYLPTLQPLLDWKTEQGYPTSVGYMSEIGSTPEALKTYIEDFYQNSDPPLQYVVLVGDIDGALTVPTFYYQSGLHIYSPADHQYALLEGNDYFADVEIGRISVQGGLELSTIINKIIAYEQDPFQGGSGWFERGLLIADSSALQSLSVMQWGWQVMLDYGYDEVDSVYYYVSLPMVPTANSLNEGVGILNFRGWGDWGGWSQGNINALTNFYKLPVIFGCASTTNQFELTTCLGESWLRAGTVASPTGAIACIGPSSAETYSRWDGTLDQGMVWGWYDENIYKTSALLNRGKFELWLNFPLNRTTGYTTNSVECYYYIYNLLGDPGLSLRTKQPELIGAIHAPRIPTGRNFFQVTAGTHQGRLDDGFAALVKDGTILSSGSTDDEGFVNLALDSTSPGTANLTITAANCQPYQAEIEIFSPPGYIGYYSLSVDDDTLGFSSGNGNGIINPDETVELTISLKNFGSSSINGVVAEISAQNLLLQILEPSQIYGNFPPGAVLSNSEPYVIDISSICPDLTEFVLSIEARDAQHHRFTSQCPLIVSAPAIQIIGCNFPQSQPDTLLMPGADTDLILTIRNGGGEAWDSLNCTLICSTAGVVFSDTISQFPQCLPGDSVSNLSNPFHLSVEELIFPGIIANLELCFQRADGWVDTLNLPVNIGIPTIFDPVMPMDNYGYYCFDDGDVSYHQVPDYYWIEINPNSGGAGTLIPLTDSSPNQGDNELIDLPPDFHFRHYGEEVSQITVCSNGWLSCGPTPVWEFRNKPIPAAGEPYGMIAPFWDDLVITGIGGVYQYYHPQLDAFILEWFNLHNVVGNALETFQVILWDADTYLTPTGDSPISFLYNTVNDVDDLYGWSTVGILNNDTDGGLQYLYSGIYTPGASTLHANTALYFTTDPSTRMLPPMLSFSPTNFTFNLQTGGTALDSIMIANSGEAELSYQLDVSLWTSEGSGGPDPFGYIWIDSDEPGGGTYNWVDITGVGTEIIFPHNDSTSADIPFGFQFPFYGNYFNSIIVSANGWLSFTSHSSAFNNTPLPSVNAPENLIAPYWDDLNPLIGECRVFIWGNMEDSLVVSFINIRHYGSVYGLYTFQAILEANGKIALQYQSMSGNTYSATIGIQNSTKTIGLLVVYNQVYVHNNLRIDIQRPWLTLGAYSGTVLGGQTVYIPVEADAGYLLPGSYSCDISLTTNDPNHLYQIIPASLEVTNYQTSSLHNLQIEIEGNTILLSWTPGDPGTVYRIFRSSSPNFESENTVFLGETGETSFRDQIEVGEESRFYRVVVTN